MTPIEIKADNTTIAIAQSVSAEQIFDGGSTTSKLSFTDLQFTIQDVPVLRNNVQCRPVNAEYQDDNGNIWSIENIWFNKEVDYQPNVLQNVDAECETMKVVPRDD